MVRLGTVFSYAAFRYVDVIIGATWRRRFCGSGLRASTRRAAGRSPGGKLSQPGDLLRWEAEGGH